MTEKQIERLLKIVSDVFKIEDITKQTRLQKYVQARTVVMKILRDSRIGTAQIGDLLNKHHSSIIHHTKNFDFQLRFDKKLHSKYETVKLMYAKGNNIIYQLSHDELIKYTFSLEERFKKTILLKNRSKNYEKLFKFIESNVPESNLRKAKQRLKDLTDGLYN